MRPASALSGLRLLLVGLARAPEDHPDRRGCLVVNSATERVPADPGTTALVGAQLGRLEEALAAVVRRGQMAGEIRGDRDATAMARNLVSIVQGMRVVGKATGDVAALRDTAELAVATLAAGDPSGLTPG